MFNKLLLAAIWLSLFRVATCGAVDSGPSISGVWDGTWLGYDAKPPFTDKWTFSESQAPDGTISVVGSSVRQEAQTYTFSLYGSRVGNHVTLTVPFGSGWEAEGTVTDTTFTGTWILNSTFPDAVRNMPQNHGPLTFTREGTLPMSLRAGILGASDPIAQSAPVAPGGVIAKIPLGSRFYIQLLKPDQAGNPQPILSTFVLGTASITPAIPGATLFS
jgi:hypothetical protein